MLYSCIYDSSDPWNGLLRNRILVRVSKHSCFKACKDSHLQRHTNIYSHCQVLLIQSPRQLNQVMLAYMVCYVLLVARLLISPPRCVCYSTSKHVCWLMTLRFALPYLRHRSSLAQTRSVTLSISSTAFWNFFTTQKSKRRSRNSYLGGTSEFAEILLYLCHLTHTLWFSQVFPNYSNGNWTTSSTWVSSKIKQRRAAAKKVAEGSGCAADFSSVVWASHCSFVVDIFEI